MATSRRFLRELVTSEHKPCGRLAANFVDSIGPGNQLSISIPAARYHTSQSLRGLLSFRR